MKSGINVLSLCDGMACGRIALAHENIFVENYFSSEINKHSINVAQSNYPDIIQLGDINKIKCGNDSGIDLVIGGTPCQGFSFSGKLLNFDDKRSMLFFQFCRILESANPKYFLFENVQMTQESESIITSMLGVKPILINSNLVSAQTRKRLYWTNIPNVYLPIDRGIKFSDVVTDGVCAAMRGRYLPGTKVIKQFIECRQDDKSNCLTTVSKDNVIVKSIMSKRLASEVEYRYLSAEECERLQTVPIGYTRVASDTQRKIMLGEGWTIDVIRHVLTNIK